MILNDDVWLMVLQYFEGDFKMLYNLLTVNKRTFLMVLPILYKNPFSLRPDRLTDSVSFDQRRMDFSHSRLEYLFTLTSGYYKAVARNKKPNWDNPIMLPTTVNYSSFVTKIPRALVVSWKTLWERRYALPESILSHVKYHAEKITTLSCHSREIKRLIKYSNRLSCLETIHVWDSIYDQQELKEFMMIHQDLYPGVLNRLLQDSRRSGETIQLLNSIQPLEHLDLPLGSSVDHLELLDTTVSKVRYAKISYLPSGNEPDLELGPLLARMRQLKEVSINFGDDLMFDWAKAEHDLAEENEQFLVNSQASGSRSQSESIQVPLVELKKLELLRSRCKPFKAALYAFRDTLESASLETRAVHSFTGSLLTWTWRLPQLTTLKLANVGLCLDVFQYCSSLKTLLLKNMIWFVSGQENDIQDLEWADRSNTLRQGIDRDSLLMESLSKLKGLTILEIETPARPTNYVDDTLYITSLCFPQLINVVLKGRLAGRIKGQFLQVATNLETLELVGNPSPGHQIMEGNRANPWLTARTFGTLPNRKQDRYQGSYPKLTRLSLSNWSMTRLESRMFRRFLILNNDGLDDGMIQPAMFPSLSQLELHSVMYSDLLMTVAIERKPMMEYVAITGEKIKTTGLTKLEEHDLRPKSDGCILFVERDRYLITP